ncbi:MAG TPA: polysaccharide biosynthesis tyrosine autokinase [Candidatus Eisenbacteria bacterium]|nr:polysaccharide biosynthesis tyrosine autokinase [Candidatus Eisenbacteria bacterium]
MNDLARHYMQAPNRAAVAAGRSEEVAYYYPAGRPEENHLRDYWKIVLKRSRIMVPIFLAVVAIGMLSNFLSPTLYTAKSTIKIEPHHPSVTGVPEMLPAQLESGPYDYYQTQFALLQSAPLAARVILDLDLQNNASFTGEDQGGGVVDLLFGWVADGFDFLKTLVVGRSRSESGTTKTYELGVPPWSVAQYLSYLKIEPVRNTRLVNIIFTTPDPKLSQSLANAHASAFIQMLLENRFNLTKEARDFLAKKLAELRENVQRAEQKLNQFRQQHGVVSFEKGENIVIDRLVDLNKQLTQARAQRIEAESMYQVTRNKNNQYLAQVLNSPVIQQLKAAAANLEAEKSRLLSIFTPEHPRVQEINRQVAQAQRNLNAEIATIVRGIEANYASARAREEALEAEAKRQQEIALSLKEVGVDYAVLNEEVIVNRGLYENVLKRLNETAVANDIAASNVQVVQRSEVPLSPSSPNTARAMLLSSALGLILALGFAFFAEYMDATVNTPQAVWAAVSLTTLGVVPHLKTLRDRYVPGAKIQGADFPRPAPVRGLSKELVVERDHLSLIAESYRSIRTALMLSQAEHPPKTILLTSPCPDEGKTVTTLNLGIALAHGGPRVLIIDADLRKGRCHKLLNVSNQRGLANVLAGQSDIMQAVKPTGVRNCDLLPRGTLPPNPSDLLMSQKMREVLRTLRDSYDFILLDSPPAIAVSDAAVLSALCDGVVLVFHGQKTTTPTARRAVERLEHLGAPLLGVILNGIDIRDPDYADYRSYYPAYYATVQSEAVPVHEPRPRQNAHPVGERVPDGSVNGAPQAREVATVPREFFDRMAARLSQAVGPAGRTIVPDQVAILRESLDAFPMARVWELAQVVSQEILDGRSKARFLREMSREIRELQSRYA